MPSQLVVCISNISWNVNCEANVNFEGTSLHACARLLRDVTYRCRCSQNFQGRTLRIS